MSIERLDVSKPSTKKDLKDPLVCIQNECAARGIDHFELMRLYKALCKTTREKALQILASGHIYPLQQLLQIYPDFFDADTLIVEPKFHTPAEEAAWGIRVMTYVAESTRRIIEWRNKKANTIILHTAWWKWADMTERLVVCDNEMKVICWEDLWRKATTVDVLRMILDEKCIALAAKSQWTKFYFPQWGRLRSFDGPIRHAA